MQSRATSHTMFGKKDTYTICTPLASWVRRDIAIIILHSHPEVITLNPLVIDHKAIPPPRTAPTDEYYSTWYEIRQKIQYVPGIGRMGEGEIKFNGCFHNLDWGLQTHIYAPFNVDLRIKYRIAGNQPGEPPETLEIGLSQAGAPKEGLYLREDIQIKCNVAAMPFVKSQLKVASKEMVARIIRKAELVERGKLIAIPDERGHVKIINPADQSRHVPASLPSSVLPIGRAPPQRSHSQLYHHPLNPSSSPGIPFATSRPQHVSLPAGFRPPPFSFLPEQPDPPPVEMAGSYYYNSPISPVFPGSDRSNRDSYQSRYSQLTYSTDGYRSPGLEQTGFVSELPTHNEAAEGACENVDNQNQPDRQPPSFPLYNPADYVPCGANKYEREQRQSTGTNQ